MMPFSVLRIWCLGLISWAILGLAIYLVWEWADGTDPEFRARQVRNPATGELVTEQIAVPADQRDTQGGTAYLAGGLALLLLSFGGFAPGLLLCGRPSLRGLRSPQPGESRMVSSSDGAKIHVRIYGPENRATVLLTHGWSLDHSDWVYVVEQLSERFRIVVWDLPGLGHSERPRQNEYSVEQMARALNAVIDSVGSRPLILVGHSLGGMILQTYCRLFPQQLSRVQGLVLVHTTYTNPLKTAVGAPLWRTLQKPVVVPLNYLTIALSPLVWLSNWQSYLNGSLHISSRLSSFAGKQTWGQVDLASRLFAKASPAVVARGNLAMLQFDEQRTLPLIDKPVLIVSGRNDRLTKPAASDYLERQLPHAMQIQLHPAGHLGHWEQHPSFVEALAEFADKYGSGSPAEQHDTAGTQQNVARDNR